MFAEINKEAFSVLPFVLNTVGQSPDQRPINHPAGINYHEFIWVKHGCGSFTVDGNSFTLTADEGVFIRRGIPHSYEGEELHTAWFTFSMEERALDFLSVPRYLRFNVPDFLNSENDALEKFSNGDSTVLSRSSAGYSYVTELFSALLPPPDSPDVLIRHYLESHYSSPVTLDEIARHVGMTRYSVCRYYMKKRGISVMDELNRIRIAKAKRFLRYTSDPVEKIGRMCGFESASYFAKRFRSACGKSPAAYRSAYSR